MLGEHEGRPIHESRHPSNFRTRSSNTTQSTMDKEGIFIIVPLPLLARKVCTNWIIHPVMATRFQRPAMALEDDEEDFHSVRSRNVGEKSQAKATWTTATNSYGWTTTGLETLLCRDRECNPGLHQRLTKYWDVWIVNGRGMLEPSICSNQDNFCTSSLSSKEEVSRYDSTNQF